MKTNVKNELNIISVEERERESVKNFSNVCEEQKFFKFPSLEQKFVLF